MTNLVVVNLNIHCFENSKPPIVQTSLKLLLPILETKTSCQNQNIQRTTQNNPSAFSVLVGLNQQRTRGCNITVYLSWTFGACKYQVSCRNMGKIPRNMNGVFELTRRNSPGEHLQPLSPLDPPPKGGVTRNFRGHAPAAVSEGVLKKKSGHASKLREEWCPDFLRGGRPKIFGTHSRCGFGGCPDKKNRDTPRTAGKLVS